LADLGPSGTEAVGGGSLVGRELGHFRVTAPIGAGGMGVVYEAIDLRLQRPVALKLLPADISDDPGRRSRFEREARAASALNHPNIVTVYEIDRDQGLDFIAMELVEGETLTAAIERGLPLAEALRLAGQIAQALAAAHAAGIVHRDLKPGNVMVRPDGQPKVLDFGLAKRLAGGALDTQAPTLSGEPQTAPGVVAGTLAYMSPEQAEGRLLDARSDIFSFGVLLFEMLTGRRPFSGQNAAQVLSAILRDSPPRVRSLRGDLPAELDGILARALEKDVDRRYQRASDLAADLAALRPAPAGASPASWRRPAVRAAGLLLLAALAAIAGRSVFSRRVAAPAQFRLLSTFPGSHRSPSLSPDGRLLAYVDVARGTPQIWVKPVAEGDPVQVTTGDAAAARPRWSPKGDVIVFERRRAGIWLVPPLGGPPRQVLERGSCPAFFPDGERLVFDRDTTLWVASLDGSDARPLAGVPDNFYSFYLCHSAAVSPDGQSIVYFQPQWGPYGDFWILPASGGNPRRLTFDVTTGGGAVFARDGRSVIVSSGRGGSQTLWRVPTEGGDPEPVTTGAGEDAEPELSADGRTLVYSNARNTDAIMVLDTRTGAEREVLAQRAHTNGAVFSSDGRRIAFFAVTEQHEQIFTIAADGSDLRPVTRGLPGYYTMPRFSPDGSSLYYFTHDPPSFRRIAAAGGAPETIVDGWLWGGVVTGAWLDPAGRFVAYTDRRNASQRRALVRELATGAEQPLAQPIFVSSWTRDGTAVLGLGRGNSIVRCPRDGTSCDELGKGSGPVPSADGSRIFFQRAGPPLDDLRLNSLEVWVMSDTGKDARRVATLGAQSTLASRIDVSPRDEIVWVQSRRGKEELWAAQLPN
jgi:Tol biopolymer transport system component